MLLTILIHTPVVEGDAHYADIERPENHLCGAVAEVVSVYCVLSGEQQIRGTVCGENVIVYSLYTLQSSLDKYCSEDSQTNNILCIHVS